MIEINKFYKKYFHTNHFIHKIFQSYSANYYLFSYPAGPVHKCSLHPYYVILDFSNVFKVGNGNSLLNLALLFNTSFKKFYKFY